MQTDGIPSEVKRALSGQDICAGWETVARECYALMCVAEFLTLKIPERRRRLPLFDAFTLHVKDEAVRCHQLFNVVSVGGNPQPKHMAAMVAASFIWKEPFAQVMLTVLPTLLNKLVKEHPEKRGLYAGGVLGVFEGFALMSSPTPTLRTATITAVEQLLIRNPKKWSDSVDVTFPDDLDGTFQNVVKELKEKDKEFLRLILGVVSNYLREAGGGRLVDVWAELPSLTQAVARHLERSVTEIWERLEGMSDIPSAPVGKPFQIPPGWKEV